MTWSFFTISLCIHITPCSPTPALGVVPFCHNENTQVVTGGETVEGECEIYVLLAYINMVKKKKYVFL